MKKDRTEIVVLLDRSGSMESIAMDVVGGINAFVDEQRKAPGEGLFTLIQFDSHDPAEVVCEAVNVQSLTRMTAADFCPRGATPLLDAMGRAIIRTGNRLAAMNEADRPELVVFVVFTDGHENASREFTRERIRCMVKEQTDKCSWRFVFLGADIDSFAEAGGLGLKNANTADVDKNNMGDAMFCLGEKVRNYREHKRAEAMDFSEDDRQRMRRRPRS